ncbi:MAG: hypothetical protein ABEI39_06685 [Halobacteriales archaeon]
MIPRTLRRLGYGLLVAEGVLSALAPRLALRKNLLPLSVGFEDAADLSPREWYLRAVRACGVGMLAAGLAGLVLERDPEDAA